MDTRLELYLAKQEIIELLHRYCRGVDRCDEDLVRSAYYEDSTDDRGYWRGSGWDLARFVTDRQRRVNASSMHSVSNFLIDVDGSHASSECHLIAHMVRRDTPNRVDSAGVRLLDRLERRDGEWRITRRKVLLEWAHVSETVSDPDNPLDLSAFARGERYPTDLVYAREGLRP